MVRINYLDETVVKIIVTPLIASSRIREPRQTDSIFLFHSWFPERKGKN